MFFHVFLFLAGFIVVFIFVARHFMNDCEVTRYSSKSNFRNDVFDDEFHFTAATMSKDERVARAFDGSGTLTGTLITNGSIFDVNGNIGGDSSGIA